MASIQYVGRIGALAVALGIGAAVTATAGSAWAEPDAGSSSASPDSSASPGSRAERVQSRLDRRDHATQTTSKRHRLSGTEKRSEAKKRNAESSEGTTADRRDQRELDSAARDGGTAQQTSVDIDGGVPAPVLMSPTAPKRQAAVRTMLADRVDAPADGSRGTPDTSAIVWALLTAARRSEESAALRAPTADYVLAAANSAPAVTKTNVAEPGWVTGKVRIRVTASDPDRDPLTYTASTPSWGAVTVNRRGWLSYSASEAARHAAAAGGPSADGFIVTVSDGNGGSTAVFVTVAIAPTNDAPSGKAVVNKANPATGVITGKVNAIDPDGDGVSFSGSGNTARGSVIVNADGSFVYTPTPEARAAATNPSKRSDDFVVTINDGHGGITTVKVKVSVVPPDANRAPVVGSTPYTITAVSDGDGRVTGYVTVTDPDGFGLSYQLLGGFDGNLGSVAVDAATGAFSYTPTVRAREAAYASPGEDTVRFTIVASDGLATATVEVTAPISAKAPPPPAPVGLRWPLANVRINRGFGNGHNGIDLYATAGTPVYAAADGVISFEGYGQNNSGMGSAAGICVLIWHPSLNIYTGYAHMSSTIINNGQAVSKGQLIGYSGYTGNVIPAGPGGAHLHFEALPKNPNFSNGYSGRIDPAPYIR